MRTHRLSFLWVLPFSLTACSAEKSVGSDPGCGGGSSCAAGEVCITDICEQVCLSNRDCTAAGELCVDDICVPSQGDELPTIASIAGTGTPDGATGHAAQHVGGALVITGDNLGNATVTLSDGGQAWTLEVCDNTNTRVEVVLPGDATRAGEYLLTVTTQAGSCAATVPFLQGETGAPGLDGSDGASGAAGPQGPPPTEAEIQAAVSNLTTLDVSTLAGRAASEYHGTLVWGRYYESEGPPLDSTLDLGTMQTDAAATGGEARKVDYSDVAGKFYGFTNADVGEPIALGRSVVEYRLKVSDNGTVNAGIAASDIAALTCQATRADGSRYELKRALQPGLFEDLNTWQSFGITCDFLPDDQDQFVGIGDYAPLLSDFFVDNIRVTPTRQPAGVARQDIVWTSGTNAVDYHPVSTSWMSLPNLDTNPLSITTYGGPIRFGFNGNYDCNGSYCSFYQIAALPIDRESVRMVEFPRAGTPDPVDRDQFAVRGKLLHPVLVTGDKHRAVAE